MRFKTVPALASIALLLGASFAARAQQGQQQDQKVIDDFVTTRGVSFDEPSHATQTQKQTTHTAPSSHRNSSGSVASKGHAANSSGSSVASNKNSSTANGSKKGSTSGDKGHEVAAQSEDAEASDTGVQTVKTSASVGGNGQLRPVGLGYTVFMKDNSGGLVAVNTSQEYHSGDRIAIALEPNTEGYIYVFDAENDSNPVMLFPSIVLDGGANVAHAHVRETYPTDVNYAFEFDANPAIENVYVIISRHPLAGVPTGDALANFCGKKRDNCEWRPTTEQWRRIRAGATDHHVVEAKNTQIAQLQAQPIPPANLQRGIRIKRDDPAPAIVRVADSPEADALVTVIKLVHK